MYSVNEFLGGEIVAAYSAGEMPAGKIIGRQGNAVLILDGDREIVVSRPWADGPVPGDGPLLDLAKYFA